MNTKRGIKIIKKRKCKVTEIPTRAEYTGDPNRWSRAVQLWISEFQRRRRSAYAIRMSNYSKERAHSFHFPVKEEVQRSIR